MSNLDLFNQSWNDTVFEGRNKEYGAFQLRKENPKTTLKALLYGTLLAALLLSIPVISNLTEKNAVVINNDSPVLDDFIYVNLEKKPEIKPEKLVTPINKPEKSSTIEKKYVSPTVVDHTDVATELPTLDPEVSIKTGNIDNPGDSNGNIAIGNSSPKGSETGTGEGSPIGTGSDIHINAGLQSSPEFPGGIKNFLEQVGNKFKTPSVEENGTMKIHVSFVVEKDGTLSNIKVLRDPGYGLGNEAIRVLKSIKTKWKPGYQNDKPVRTAYNLPISVVMKNS